MTAPYKPTDLLSHRPMPEVAALLRSRIPRIIDLWTAAVEQDIPDANPLTVTQVRNSIPMVLEKVALALESDQPQAIAILSEVGTAHGVVRFQEDYSIDEVLVEYRLLRRIVFDELHAASNASLSYSEILAVNMAIDLALQRGVTSYVRYLTQQLKSAADAESKYLSFLSHDLRNNLSGVTLTVEWLAHRLATLDDFRQEVQELTGLRTAVEETVAGMDRLLQAERLRRQAVTVKLAPVDLRRLADDLIGAVVRKAAEKGLRLRNDVPPGASAYSDRELVALALQNLLGNAIKFSQRGTVRISAESDPNGWRVAVTDEGPGIAPDRLVTLFEMFARGETHGQPGVGLGLTIASHAARLLGSELQVQSEPGKGSTFSFTVPPADPKVSR